jgi:hypothetical protein
VLVVQNISSIGEGGAGNIATVDGGGIYNQDGTTLVSGSIILDNMAVNTGGGVYNNCNGASVVTVNGSCIISNSDASFYNNQTPAQAAQNNWWGAATGPNTPGADTTGGSVNTSGFLTAPVFNCGFKIYLPMVVK